MVKLNRCIKALENSRLKVKDQIIETQYKMDQLAIKARNQGRRFTPGEEKRYEKLDCKLEILNAELIQIDLAISSICDYCD